MLSLKRKHDDRILNGNIFANSFYIGIPFAVLSNLGMIAYDIFRMIVKVKKIFLEHII